MNKLPNPGTEPIPQQLIEQVSQTVTESTHEAIQKMEDYNDYLATTYSYGPAMIIEEQEDECIKTTSVKVKMFGTTDPDNYYGKVHIQSN